MTWQDLHATWKPINKDCQSELNSTIPQTKTTTTTKMNSNHGAANNNTCSESTQLNELEQCWAQLHTQWEEEAKRLCEEREQEEQELWEQRVHEERELEDMIKVEQVHLEEERQEEEEEQQREEAHREWLRRLEEARQAPEDDDELEAELSAPKKRKIREVVSKYNKKI